MTVTSSAEPDAPAEAGGSVAVSDPPARPSPVRAQAPNPRITRPNGLARAARPAPVPAPEHHHLPGWVRRAHGQAQPILADLLGTLEGPRRAQLAHQLDDLVKTISGGKFSQAWFYPRVIADGQTLLVAQRRERAESARERQLVDSSRKRVSDQLREVTPNLSGETAGKLTRALRTASDQAAITAVSGEVARAVTTVRSTEERRRDREIDRARARILRTLPRATAAESSTETWQDTLRRFAESQAAGGS